MTSEFLFRLLAWSLAINYAVLLVWFLALVLARDWVRNLHGIWFRIPDDAFDAIHYGGMAIYKIGILLFNLTPLLALWLVTR